MEFINVGNPLKKEYNNWAWDPNTNKWEKQWSVDKVKGVVINDGNRASLIYGNIKIHIPVFTAKAISKIWNIWRIVKSSDSVLLLLIGFFLGIMFSIGVLTFLSIWLNNQ